MIEVNESRPRWPDSSNPPSGEPGAVHLAKLLQLGKAEILEPYRTQRIAIDGTVKEVSIISIALVNEAGQMYAIATTEREGGSEQ